MNKLALFDLDHTLLPLDSDYEWGQFLVRTGAVDADAFKRDMRSLSTMLDALDQYSLETQRPVTLPLLRDLLLTHPQADSKE